MIPIAESGKVTIFCPEDGRYSFYNSPYPSHRLMTGVDIYPQQIDGNLAYSPVSGEILQVRRVKAPKGRGFVASEYDTVTVISTESSDRVVKILHVDTEITEGDKIQVGDALGSMIRSGYFGYQTPLHAHVEIRPATDPLRVRGGYHLQNILRLDDLQDTRDLKGIVTVATKGYAQIRLQRYPSWAVVDVGGQSGILDGGIPLYGWFGVHLKDPKPASRISLLGTTIGVVEKTASHSCVAQCTIFESKIDKTPVDLFFTLTPRNYSVLIVTSKKHDILDLREGEDVEVKLS